MRLDLGPLGLDLGRQVLPMASVGGIPALLQMPLHDLVAVMISPLTRPCGLVEDGPAMPPLAGNLVRRRRQFVRQHEVTRDYGPGVGRSNKGGGPRVSLLQRHRFVGCMSPLLWSNCRVAEGSAGKLHWATQAWRLLDRMEFGRAHPYFFLVVWFQRERGEALLSFTIM
jgi:hypothetical protein